MTRRASSALCRPALREALALALILAAAGAAPAQVPWSFDVTTTGGDILWTSPSSVDPASPGYDSVHQITLVEVGIARMGIPFGNHDVTGSIPPELLTGTGNVAGPAPVTIFNALVSAPPPPDPPAITATLSMGLDAAGFGFFNVTGVVLGTIDIDLGFPFGVQTVDITSLRIAGQITITPSRWADQGFALAGSTGDPSLAGAGTLLAGDTVSLTLSNALPNSTAALVIGFAPLLVPFKGGVMVPSLDVLLLGFPTGPTGDLALSAPWPAGFPPGFATYYQYWISDAFGPAGMAASNGVSGTTP